MFSRIIRNSNQVDVSLKHIPVVPSDVQSGNIHLTPLHNTNLLITHRLQSSNRGRTIVHMFGSIRKRFAEGFKSIYRRIAEDFAFLNDYGYYFESDMIHHVSPSVVFENDETGLQIWITYDYEDDRMYISRYDPETIDIENMKDFNPEDMLDGIRLENAPYKDLVGPAKDILRKHLDRERQQNEQTDEHPI